MNNLGQGILNFIVKKKKQNKTKQNNCNIKNKQTKTSMFLTAVEWLCLDKECSASDFNIIFFPHRKTLGVEDTA